MSGWFTRATQIEKARESTRDVHTCNANKCKCEYSEIHAASEHFASQHGGVTSSFSLCNCICVCVVAVHTSEMQTQLVLRQVYAPTQKLGA